MVLRVHNLFWISPGGDHLSWVCAAAVASRTVKVILLIIYDLFLKITFILPFGLERTSQINEKLSLLDMREVRKLKQLILCMK